MRTIHRSITLLVLVLLLAASTAGAQPASFGTIDPVPAATLLLPYFEVDLAGTGITTLLSINNASASSAIAHLTIWSDLSIPIIDFVIYHTGYDVATLNLADLLILGTLPRTGAVNTLSNRGAFSGVHVAFPNCSTTPGAIPNYNPISASFLGLIQAALTGKPLTVGPSAGRCAGFNHGDNVARGYVTIDSVSACSQLFPIDVGYFIDGGLGIANNNNSRWGDFFLVDPANNFAQGFTMVHLEADISSPPCLLGALGASQTFYCRYSVIGSDDREALGNVYAVRFLSGGAFSGGTDLLSYRDSSRAIIPPFICGTLPSPFPLNQTAIVVFDEQENPIVAPSGGPSGEPGPGVEVPFPWEANRTAVGLDLDTSSYSFGWLYLDLATTTPFALGPEVQSYVLAVMDAVGRFSVGIDAIQLNNLTAPTAHPTPPGG